MINKINNKNIGLIITVDNGVSAFEAIKKTKDLGIDLIITDHHKIPNKKFDVFTLGAGCFSGFVKQLFSRAIGLIFGPRLSYYMESYRGVISWL